MLTYEFYNWFGVKPKKIKRLKDIWYHMKHRCELKHCKAYKNYGGRGIIICEEWSDYKAFEHWALKNGYADNLTIDRKDSDGNYEPSNCRWVTKAENAKNKKSTHKLKDGRYACDVAKEYGIPYTTFTSRIGLGWSVEKACTHFTNKHSEGKVKVIHMS